MQELLGRIAWHLRRSADISQRQLAEYAGLPTSTISKLEQGIVTMSVYHVDVIADALTHFQREYLGDAARGWDGWELHHLFHEIAEGLSEAGYALLWQRPDLVRSPRFYTRGRKLTALAKAHWPASYRDRL